MKISLNILLITIFLLSANISMSQVVSGSDKEIQEMKVNKTEPLEETQNARLTSGDNKQSQNADKKADAAKQVKSARPDMSKSRGARPPDIVRPSGSRIPKGVGRPAGAGRHGRV
jgi:hypothetical protein